MGAAETGDAVRPQGPCALLLMRGGQAVAAFTPRLTRADASAWLAPLFPSWPSRDGRAGSI